MPPQPSPSYLRVCEHILMIDTCIYVLEWEKNDCVYVGGFGEQCTRPMHFHYIWSTQPPPPHPTGVLAWLEHCNVQLKYLVRVYEIGRYFSWLLLCDRACPVQPSTWFLSRVLLLGFGKLLSIKKKFNCRFVVMCVGFTTSCQNMSRSKSLPPDIHPLLFYMPRPTP